MFFYIYSKDFFYNLLINKKINLLQDKNLDEIASAQDKLDSLVKHFNQFEK